ncbi:Ubiquitin-like-specific protease 1 [Frankliniella fusca]|uniref:Ubiquitin-like-specific protease 1 n=1 Tax=Frankliniella fusca TaxID=407009 RepID=A0AAE1I1N8_9NEOP|nr:Ubiquitin-like-specific protease 1 [Frankliniella fusca]
MAERIRQNEYFNSFKEFEDCLRAYELKNCVIFKRTSTKPVDKYNARLQPGQTKLDECLFLKYGTYNCVHGGPVRPSQSKGLRPNQRTLQLHCPAQISLVGEACPKQRLKISSFKHLHQNHPVGNSNFAKHYSKNKKLDKTTKELVTTMFKCRGKNADIVHQIQETTGKAVNSKDISNIKQQYRMEQRLGKTPEEDLILELKKMLKDDPGSQYVIGHVENETDVDDTENNEPKLVDFIFFQTKAMRDNLEQFPEILGLDTTYDVNKHNMHLSVVQAIDNHKNGRIVGYIFLRRETSNILESALKVFVAKNPDVVNTVKTVIVDKDYKEISGVRKVLPNVHVHLCHTHVRRIFSRRVKGEENASKLTKILNDMCLSDTAEVFHNHYNALKSVASPDFMLYFDQYWLNIQAAWVLYVRDESLSLGVRSTNHVESHNDKIKKVITRTSTLGDCVRELLRLHFSREFESSYRNFLEQAKVSYLAHNQDPNVKAIFSALSDWGASLLVSELKKSYDLSEDILLDKDENTCTCHFFKMFGIGLCQHIFYHRLQEGINKITRKDLLNPKDLPTRWLNQSLRQCNRGPNPSQTPSFNEANEGSSSCVMRTTPRGPKPMDKTSKYRKALKICTEICSILSLNGGHQYEKRIQDLEKILEYWMYKKEIVVLPVNANGTVDLNVAENIQVDDATLEKDKTSTTSRSANANDVNPPCENILTSPNSIPSYLKLALIVRGPHREPYVSEGSAEIGKLQEQTPTKDDSKKFESLSAGEDGDCSPIRHPKEGSPDSSELQELTPPPKYDAGNSQEIDSPGEAHLKGLNCKSSPPSKYDAGNSQEIDSPGASEDSDLSTIRHSRGGSSESRLELQEFTPTTDDTKDIQIIESPGSGKNLDLPPIRTAGCDWAIDDSTLTMFGLTREEFLSGVQVGTRLEPGTSPPKFVLPEQKLRILKDKTLPDKNGIEERCARGSEIPKTDVTQLSDVSWCVKSQNRLTKEKSYKVIELRDSCKISSCSLEPCRHRFSCTCMDYKYSGCTCKHINAVFQQYFRKAGSDTSSSRVIFSTSLSPDNIKLPSHSVQGRPRNKTPLKPIKTTQNISADSDKGLPWEIKNFEYPDWSMLKHKYKCSAITLSKADFECLKAGEFLFDSTIDVFSTLMIADNENQYAEIESIPSNALQCTQLGMQCYLSNIDKNTFVLNDMLVVPSNINLNHWVLFLVLTKLKCIVILDPLYSKKSVDPNVVEHLLILRYFLECSYHFCFQGLKLDWEEWKLYAPRDFPRQPNGYDCGVYVCLWTYSACCGNTLHVSDFSSTKLKAVRKFVFQKIMSNSEEQADRSSLNKPTLPSDSGISHAFFADAIQSIKDGAVEVNRMWDNVEAPDIIYSSPVPGKSSLQVIGDYLKHLSGATDHACEAPGRCKLKNVKGIHQMYLLILVVHRRYKN